MWWALGQWPIWPTAKNGAWKAYILGNKHSVKSRKFTLLTWELGSSAPIMVFHRLQLKQ